MARPPKDPSQVASVSVAARITPAERDALVSLQQARSSALVSSHQPPDDSFAGWLRHLIRREAAEEGIEIPGETAITPKRKKGARK